MRTVEIEPRKLALNVALWQKHPINRIADDLASASREQRRGAVWDRTNVYSLRVNPDGQLVDNFGQAPGLRNETNADLAENAAFFRIQRWAEKNNQGVLIWISPPGGENYYKESRFLVMEIGYDEDGQKVLRHIAICGTQSSQECLKIARRLLTQAPNREPLDLRDPEELRRNPIPVEVPPNTSLVTFFKKYLGPERIWKEIESGRAEENKRSLEPLAREIAEKYYPLIIAAQTVFEQIKVGASMEKELEKRAGFKFQAIGSCGMSNSAVLDEWAKIGIFDQMLLMAKENQGIFVKKCPYCGASICRIIRPGYRCVCGRVFLGIC